MNHVLYSKAMSVRCCPRNGKRAKHQIHCANVAWEGDACRSRLTPVPLVSPETGPQHKVTTQSLTQQTRGGRALFGLLRARSCGALLALLFPADRTEGSAMSIISSTGHSTTTSSTTTLSQRLTAAVCASILGACLVYFAGFSHIEAVHNAAHDTRHSAAFPCH